MNIFQPDTVLAPQFFATLRRQAPSKRGEWQLVIAVLEDAINCFQKYFLARDNHGQRLFREAYEWIMNPPPQPPPDDRDAPSFSFEYICDVLGLDPDYLRQGLLRWREEQLTKRPIHAITLPKPPTKVRLRPPNYYDLPAATVVLGPSSAATSASRP